MFDNCSSLIACWSCGVITRDWVWRRSSRGVSAIAGLVGYAPEPMRGWAGPSTKIDSPRAALRKPFPVIAPNAALPSTGWSPNAIPAWSCTLARLVRADTSKPCVGVTRPSIDSGGAIGCAGLGLVREFRAVLQRKPRVGLCRRQAALAVRTTANALGGQRKWSALFVDVRVGDVDDPLTSRAGNFIGDVDATRHGRNSGDADVGL